MPSFSLSESLPSKSVSPHRYSTGLRVDAGGQVPTTHSLSESAPSPFRSSVSQYLNRGSGDVASGYLESVVALVNRQAEIGTVSPPKLAPFQPYTLLMRAKSIGLSVSAAGLNEPAAAAVRS